MIYKNRKITFQRIIHGLYYHTLYASWKSFEPFLYRVYQKWVIKQCRKKQKIRVLFILAELGAWKTEELFLKMKNHPRFEPVIGITTSQEVPGSKDVLISYLNTKNYFFYDLDSPEMNIEKIQPDIKFYYKPYVGSYPQGLYFDSHMKSIVCMIYYGFNQGGTPYFFKHSIWRYSWKAFVENKTVVDTANSLHVHTGNFVITGTPMQDSLNKEKSFYSNPWKPCGDRKKIIYAPHHSIQGTNGKFIEYSTFLKFGEFILELAKKYADKTQWAFKPHPTLYPKLLKLWGKERTEVYYDEWRNMENAQLELGEYVGLFKHSDAMIHDCCSFNVEYMYSGNPVLFLERAHYTAEEMLLGEFGYEAYLSHYHASKESQIDEFIINILNDVDPMMPQRKNYSDKYLTIPNEHTACDNIIDVILGQGAYKD